MADLSVNIAGVEFKNPIIAASGTIGFGHEYSEFYPLEELGGISCKGITQGAFRKSSAKNSRNSIRYA